MSEFVVRLTALLAVITGSMGFVLAVFAWKAFEGAPFGRVLAILIPYMAAFTGYHALLIVVPDLPLLVLGVESLAFALIIVFVWLMVRLHYQRLRTPHRGASSQ